MEERNYQYSGAVTGAGVVMGLVAGCVAAIILSIPYGYITVFIPFIYLNLIATAGFGALVGLCAGWGARKGNMQNAAMYVVVGLIPGILAEYCNWVYWIFIHSEHQFLITNPLAIVAIAKEVMKEGTWGLSSGGNVTGMFLCVIWVAEAVIIIGGAAWLSLIQLTSYICCPDCTVWFKDATKTLSYDLPADVNHVVSELKGLNFKVLQELEPQKPDKSKFLTLEIYFCPKCSKFGCFDLAQVELEQKKDKVEEKKTELIKRQLFPKEGLAALAQ